MVVLRTVDRQKRRKSTSGIVLFTLRGCRKRWTASLKVPQVFHTATDPAIAVGHTGQPFNCSWRTPGFMIIWTTPARRDCFSFCVFLGGDGTDSWLPVVWRHGIYLIYLRDSCFKCTGAAGTIYNGRQFLYFSLILIHLFTIIIITYLHLDLLTFMCASDSTWTREKRRTHHSLLPKLRIYGK